MKVALYKFINYFSLRLGKGYFWIDCGYCRRKNGKMECGVIPSTHDPCLKEKCRIFESEED